MLMNADIRRRVEILSSAERERRQAELAGLQAKIDADEKVEPIDAAIDTALRMLNERGIRHLPTGVALPGGDFPVSGVDDLVRRLRADHPFLTERWALRLVRAYGTEAAEILSGAQTASDLGRDAGRFEGAADDVRLMRRIRRDLQERDRDIASVLDQYERTVRPMHIEFVEPSKRLADVIIPRGGHNQVAIEMVTARISALLSEQSGG